MSKAATLPVREQHKLDYKVKAKLTIMIHLSMDRPCFKSLEVVRKVVNKSLGVIIFRVLGWLECSNAATDKTKANR